jgi:hypothetical protein
MLAVTPSGDLTPIDLDGDIPDHDKEDVGVGACLGDEKLAWPVRHQIE